MKIEYRNSTEQSNPFVISDFVDFDQKGRALCPCCSPSHDNKSKTLSLHPDTGAYHCFRNCEPSDIRAALGQPKSNLIPTALAKNAPPKKVTVSEAKVREAGLLASKSISRLSAQAVDWLKDRGINLESIVKHKLGLTRCKIGSSMQWAITIPIPDDRGEYYQKKRVAPWDKELAKIADYRPWKQFGIPAMVYFTHKPDRAQETWLCEGEWDAIALAQLVKDRDDVAIACFTCGCSSVPSQSELNKLPGTVTIFYDRNDKPSMNGDRPGEVGAKKVAKALGGRGKIALVPMPENCEVKGWDVSDAIKSGFILESFQRAATEGSLILEEYLTGFEKGFRTLTELHDTAPDYVEWLVPDLLTTNELYCLAAEPRAGKSLFALGLAKAIASGGKFLDRPCQQGDVVYICKEDPDDKVKERLIAQEWTREEMDRVVIHNKFSLEDLPSLVEYVKKQRPSLIVMDTLSRINPYSSCENSSEIVDVLAPLQNLAQEYNVCVLVVHHTRKKSNIETDVLDIFDSVRGSSAIRATCRGMLVLCKGKDNYRLAVENGRTAVQDLKVHLNVATLTWRLNGIWSPPALNLSHKDLVLEWFQKHCQGNVDDVFEGTLIRKKYIYELLTRLHNERVLKKVGRQRNTMYYYEPVPQVPQVEDEWNRPTPSTEDDTRKFHNKIYDTDKTTLPDQKFTKVYVADPTDQVFPEKKDFVELSGKADQSIVANIHTEVPQSSTFESVVELKMENLINQNCSKILPEQQGDHSTNRVDKSNSNIVNVNSLSEFQALDGQISGFWHTTHGYLKFVGFEGSKIVGRKSGMTKTIKTLWRGCTGEVELKSNE